MEDCDAVLGGGVSLDGTIIDVLVFHVPIDVLADLYAKIPQIYRLLNNPWIVRMIANNYGVPFQTSYKE